MVAHLQNTVTPLRGGPLHGTPAGFQYFAIPCQATTFVSGGASEIDLQLPILIQWWGKLLDQQSFSFIADETCVGAVSVYLAGQGPYQLYLADVSASGSAIRAGDFIQLAWDAGREAFQGINWTTVGSGGGLSGATQVVTAGGVVVVDPATGFVIINKAAPSATPIHLPSVVDARALVIADFGGNGGDVTITPHAGETIMGIGSAVLASTGQGAGSAASITLYPSTDVSGWIIG